MLAERTEWTPTKLQVQYEYDLSGTRHSVVRDSGNSEHYMSDYQLLCPLTFFAH
jgi:hypothetical protein